MKMHKKKVIYIVENEKSAQFRYRVHNIEQLFKTDREWDVEHRLGETVDRETVEEADLIIIERQSAKNTSVLKIIDSAQDQKKKVLFDLDDLIFDYRDLPLLMISTNSKNILYWVGYFWGIRRIAKKVDGFLCTNQFLANKLRRSFHKPVRIIPNSLNKEQIEVSEGCLKSKKKNKNTFVIGYFSGSPTHVRDFQMVEPELISFIDEYRDTSLLIVGYMSYSRQMKDLISSDRVKVIAPVNYLELQKKICEVDVNIAPLVLNDFTNCKSELKYFEAAVVETTTIASPNYSFSHAIDNGVNGFLVEKGEWKKVLEYLRENRDKNRVIAKKARFNALENYYGSKVKKMIKEAYGYFAS